LLYLVTRAAQPWASRFALRLESQRLAMEEFRVRGANLHHAEIGLRDGLLTCRLPSMYPGTRAERSEASPSEWPLPHAGRRAFHVKPKPGHHPAQRFLYGQWIGGAVERPSHLTSRCRCLEAWSLSACIAQPHRVFYPLCEKATNLTCSCWCVWCWTGGPAGQRRKLHTLLESALPGKHLVLQVRKCCGPRRQRIFSKSPDLWLGFCLNGRHLQLP